MDADQRCAQAQHESRQTPREDAPTGWRKKERLPVELRPKVKKNEGDETARTGRNGGEATSDRSQASSGAGPSQHSLRRATWAVDDPNSTPSGTMVAERPPPLTGGKRTSLAQPISDSRRRHRLRCGWSPGVGRRYVGSHRQIS